VEKLYITDHMRPLIWGCQPRKKTAISAVIIIIIIIIITLGN